MRKRHYYSYVSSIEDVYFILYYRVFLYFTLYGRRILFLCILVFQYSVVIFLIVNFVSITTISFAYLWMFVVAKRTRAAARSPVQKSESAMARRMTLIVLTDFMCWIPITILGVASLSGAQIPPQVN